MYKFIILLSYLGCCVTAGRLGLERKLWWLDNLNAGHNIPTHNVQTITTVNQRQQFLLDVLLQVQKSLVNSELVELGKILITDPSMYKEPMDNILLEFLEQARNQDILGRTEIYNPADMLQVRQLVGLQRFFVLARDWSTFQHNVCFARLHINPVMFVNALSLAIRNRPDTQDLMLPSKNEILPQLFYGNDVLVSAQNGDWENLINQTPSEQTSWGLRHISSLLPSHLLYNGGVGFMNPWQKWRMQMVRAPHSALMNGVGGGMVSGARRVNARERGRITLANIEPKARIVLAVPDQPKRIMNDIGLNIVWNNIINDQLVQSAEQECRRAIQSQIREELWQRSPFEKQGRSMQNIDTYAQREGPHISLRMQDRDLGGTSNQQISIQHTDIPKSRWRQSIKQNPIYMENQALVDDQDNRMTRKTMNLPEVNVNSERLLHKNRRYRVQSIEQGESWHPKGNKMEWQRLRDKLIGRDQRWWNNAENSQSTENHVGYPRIKDSSRLQLPWLNQQKSYINDWDTAEGEAHEYVKRSVDDMESMNFDPTRQQRRKTKLGSLDPEIILAPKISGTTQRVSRTLRGEIFLQSLKEVSARITMDKIAEQMESTRYWRDHSLQEEQRLYKTLPIIEDAMQQLHIVLEEMIPTSRDQMLNIIVDILASGMVAEEETLSTDMQRSMQQLRRQLKRIADNVHGATFKVTPLTLLYGNLSDPIIQQIIFSLNQLLNIYRQRLQTYTRNDLTANGVTIQNVQIEPLVTYWEVADADLINLIDLQLLQSSGNNLHKMSNKMVARQLRLNHQPFTVTLNVESLTNQAVAIRILLGTKVDINGRRGSLEQNRHNFITLHASMQQLQKGGNLIQLNSRDVTGTSIDVSPLSQMYANIMMGRTQRPLPNSDCQLPHRLLLPRGAVGDGLPVQLLVVVTPMTVEDRIVQEMDINADGICGLGITGINLDRLPLGFPLDRPIVNIEELMVPNIMLLNAVIYHDEGVRS